MKQRTCCAACYALLIACGLMLMHAPTIVEFTQFLRTE